MAETYLVRISVPREHAEVFEGLLASLPEAVVGRQAPLIDTGVDLRDSDELTVLAYLSEQPETETVAALVAMGQQMSGLSGIDFDIETLPDIDWVAESQSALTAIHAGRFFLRGSHDPSPVPAGAVGLLIDAQNAFGTGHHDTTHGCLELIPVKRTVSIPVDSLEHIADRLRVSSIDASGRLEYFDKRSKDILISPLAADLG